MPHPPVQQRLVSPPKDLQLALPNTINAGTFFVLPLSDFKTFVNKTELTPVHDKKQNLGVIGLRDPKTSAVWGWRRSKFQYEWFLIPVRVEKTSLKQASFLRLPQSVIQSLDQADETLKKSQREKMKMTLARQDGDFLTECFKRPLSSVVVSKYGSPRSLPSGYSYHHTGVDLRAATGTPIRASASGEVVLAEEMIVPGQTVTLYHGGGVYTSYKHLSRIDVEVGRRVASGEVIGLSGATGRVEAPHLHWEAYWKGIPADPLQLLQASEQICDPT